MITALADTATIEAMEEVKQMEFNPQSCKAYTNIDAMVLYLLQ